MYFNIFSKSAEPKNSKKTTSRNRKCSAAATGSL